MRKILWPFLFWSCLLFGTFTGNAQSARVLSPSDSIARMTLRYLHPFYKSLEKQHPFSGTYDLGFSYPLNKKWQINTSIPFGLAKYDVNLFQPEYDDPMLNHIKKISKTAWGNAMLGLSYSNKHRTAHYSYWQGFVFLPTATRGHNEAAPYMLMSNINEFHKYLSHATILGFEAAYGRQGPVRWHYELAAGFEYFLTGSRAMLSDDLYARYTLTGAYKLNSLLISADYSGLINISKTDLDAFRDRMYDVINIGIYYIGNIVQPGLFFAYNARDFYRDIADGSMGIKLSYRFAN
ncbi:MULTISPECIES: hypothetical protein [unclassified Carboxylicivirga]|uniref:hypothetical protein n=1 Tax=Carboxylicivirga TaxID=1628153 RepID=UPI003D34BDBF